MASLFTRVGCLLTLLAPLSLAVPLVTGSKHGISTRPTAEIQSISIVDLPTSVLLSSPSVASETYGRITTLSAECGSLLASFTTIANDGTHRIVVASSPVQSLDFSNVGSIATSPGDLDNAYLLELDNGRILAAYRNHDRVDGLYSVFRITLSRSDDGGKTWVFLSEPVVRPATRGAQLGVWEPFLRLAADGTLQLFYSYETSASDQDTHLLTSLDRGLTWSSPKVVTGGAQRSARDGMVGVARASITDPAELVMVMETMDSTSPSFKIICAYSHDDGFTWDDTRQVIYEPTTRGRNAGAPQVAYIADKGVIVTFMTDDDLPSVDWPKIASVKAIVASPLRSASGTLHWNNSSAVLVSPANSYWAGIEPVNGMGLVSFAREGRVQAHFVEIVA